MSILFIRTCSYIEGCFYLFKPLFKLSWITINLFFLCTTFTGECTEYVIDCSGFKVDIFVKSFYLETSGF